MSDIKIKRTGESRINSVDYSNLGFGAHFSDHVFISDYYDGEWRDKRIEPYGPMEIYPTNCTIHYGQTIFEGLKAFYTAKGGVNVFRPEMNAKRMINSAMRLCIPPYTEADFLEAVTEIIKTDNNWIPKEKGRSLYIRPFSFGTGNFLGVHASDKYRFMIVTSPVASYYKEGLKPVKIKVATEYIRAAPGGLGAAKTAANYAASLKAGEIAKKEGYSQVLWLDAVSRKFVNEVGAMNMMFLINDELITPSLESGTILPGVTRDSVIRLAKDWGMKVTERNLSIDEVIEANQNGTLQECFGTGTAAVISPVGLLKYKEIDIIINNQEIGPVAQKFYDTITGIQYGEIEDTYGWNLQIES